MRINVTRSSLPPYEEYLQEIKDIWETAWLTNMGQKHKKLESELQKYFNVPHVSLFTNGHLALEGAIALFNFPQGSEIITTPFSFVSTANAIVRNGLIPVFCDIREDNYTIDADKIESLITDKTVAIVAVHVYGHVCDVEKIERIAKKHNLKVIYDAAHAFGVSYKGKSIANYGDVSMFSFHATKVFNTIEGGCVCYAKDSYEQVFYDMKNFGIHDEETCLYFGGNAKMSEFQAAMGICNLRHIDEYINKRKELYLRYLTNLSGVQGIVLPKIPADLIYNYSYLPVVFKDYKYTRDQIKQILADHDIGARKYFYPLINELKCYKEVKYKGKTPIAKRISENVLTLPLYPDLAIEDVDLICNIILGNFN